VAYTVIVVLWVSAVVYSFKRHRAERDQELAEADEPRASASVV
jgi:hypothetical protein